MSKNHILKTFWVRWKVTAQKIGNFQARIILSAFYFIFVPPFALGVKIFSDPLRLNKNKGSFWTPEEPRKNGLQEAKRQF